MGLEFHGDAVPIKFRISSKFQTLIDLPSWSQGHIHITLAIIFIDPYLFRIQWRLPTLHNILYEEAKPN